MKNQKQIMFWIKFPYWLGIAADALWSAALLIPAFFTVLVQNPDFTPDLQVKSIMGIGGALMTGWTFLLIWALRKPIERRFVILLTAFPVVFGIFIVTLIMLLDGNNSSTWILIKTIVLMITMITSYLLAGKVNNTN